MRHWFRSMCLAAAASVGIAASSQAAVIYSGVLNLSVPNTFDGLFVNVVTGSTFAGPGFPTTGGPGANYDFNPFGSTSWSFFSPGSSGQDAPTPVPAAQKGYVAATTSSPVSNLGLATIVDGSSVFNSGTPSGSLMATGSEAFFGFRFRNETGGLNTTHFGWARVTLTNGQPGTLVDYAWESDANVGIAVGAGIPEPTSLAAVALTGLAVLHRRRRA